MTYEMLLSVIALDLFAILLNLIVSRRNGHGYPKTIPWWYWCSIARKYIFGTRSKRGIFQC